MVSRLLTVLALATGLSCDSSGSKPIELKIRGSDSEVNLVQRLGEAFAADNGDISVAVTGGGSGVGITALIDGRIDIANSSRPLLAEEQLLALRKDVRPVATLFATDALSVIVHLENPVESLTVRELGAIYAGTVTSWDTLGGSGPIVAYGRQSSSGTYMFFRDAVVKGDFSTRVREMNGNAQIAEAVSRDPGGIGYLAVGYLKASRERVRVVPIRSNEDATPVSPLDIAAVRAGRYPIVRPLFQYTNGPPMGATLRFLLYELSPEGEELIEEMGFHPLIDAWRDRNAHLLGSDA
jgi:phosphate transport system substrate-binding protein